MTTMSDTAIIDGGYNGVRNLMRVAWYKRSLLCKLHMADFVLCGFYTFLNTYFSFCVLCPIIGFFVAIKYSLQGLQFSLVIDCIVAIFRMVVYAYYTKFNYTDLDYGGDFADLIVEMSIISCSLLAFMFEICICYNIYIMTENLSVLNKNRIDDLRCGWKPLKPLLDNEDVDL